MSAFSETAPADRGIVRVGGSQVHWRASGPAAADALVLVHGAAANWHWWDPVLPHLDARRRLVRLDLTGHGQSSHRNTYDANLWADEIAAVVAAATSGRATLVGHSMGGRVGVFAAAAHAEAITGLVLVESPIRRPRADGTPPLRRRPVGPRTVYPTREDALRAFHLLPPQPFENPAELRRLAELSITAVEGGWATRSDPRTMYKTPDAELAARLRGLRCPVAVVRGALSPSVDDAALEFMRESIAYPFSVIDVPGGHHHLMFDDPLALALTIEELVDAMEDER